MAAPSNTKRITMSVFDLALFESVKLGLDMPLPKKPESVEEALSLVGNDTSTLLSVIYDGLVERAVESAKNQGASSFYTFDEEDKLTANHYIGSPVDEDKEKAINAVVLNLAKAVGYSKDLSSEKKRELKQNAINTIRTNPAMLSFITGQPVATPAQSTTPILDNQGSTETPASQETSTSTETTTEQPTRRARGNR